MNSFDLPRVCLLTGEQSNIVFKETKFQYVPLWVRLAGLFVALIQLLVVNMRWGDLDSAGGPLPGQLMFILPFLHLLVVVIVVLAARKAKGALPFTEAAHGAMKKRQLFVLSFGSAATLMLIAGFSAERLSGVGLLLGLVVAIVIPAGVYQKMLKSKVVRCTMIEKDGRVTLSIPSGQAASMISQHLSGPRMALPA